MEAYIYWKEIKGTREVGEKGKIEHGVVPEIDKERMMARKVR